MAKRATLGVLRSLGMFLSVAAWLANGQAAAQVSLAARTDLALGQAPVAGVAASFTGSSAVKDLAVVNSGGASVSVLLGNHDGTFQAATNYPVGNTPVAVVAASFNSTTANTNDMAILNQADATVTIWQNDGSGNGTFGSSNVTPIETGCTQPTAMVEGAFGNGTNDLAVTCFFSATNSYAVAVMIGTGTGSLNSATPSTTYTVGTNPVAIGIGDFNGDGKLDLAVANAGDGTVSILLGNGDGSFQPPVTYTVGTIPTNASSMVVDKLNSKNNAFDDIAVGSFVLLGNGDGTFQSPGSVNTGGGVIVASANLNADGYPDLIAVAGASASSGSTTVMLANGDGTFQSPSTFAVAPGPVAAVTATFASNPNFDIVTVNQNSSTASVLLGHGDGTFQVAGTTAASATQNIYGSAAIADFNNDGLNDVAGVFSVTGSEGGVDLFLAGHAGFGAPTAVTLTSSSTSPALNAAAADFNHDGLMDMAVTSGGKVAVLLATSNATFGSEVDYDAGPDPGGIVAGDFNNDGTPDLVVTDQSGNQVWVLLGNGDGTFGTAQAYSAGTGPVALAALDVNGDGNLDLAVANSQGLTVLLGNGAGGFQGPTTYLFGANPSAIAAGDLNRDGIPDLVVANSGSNYVSVLLGTSSGIFNPPASVTVGMQPSGVAVADFDLDGKADLAVLNTGWNDVSILVGDGLGSFAAPVNFGANGGTAMAVADFDGDGSPDVVVLSGDTVSILVNQASGASALLSPSLVSFPATGTGLKSPPMVVTLGNFFGTAALSNVSVSIAGLQSTDFSQTNTCGTSVAAGSSCQITITFTPSALGLRSAVLKVADSAFNTPQTVALTGTGASPNPSVAPSPTSLTFTAQDVGTTSPPQGVTLTNTGVVDVSITSVTFTGAQASEFSQINNCGSTLTAGSQCTINVSFSPLSGGTRTASLSIADNASNSPQTVALSGTGNAPIVSLLPASWDFGNTTVGATSSALTVTLTNTGTAQLSLTSFAISGDFAVPANTCLNSKTLDVGASCSITITFTPTVLGSRSGTLTVTDSAAGSPHTVSLTGTGIAATTTLTPASVSFGNVYLGNTGTAQTVTFTNTSAGSVTITSIVLGGANVSDFVESNTCPGTLGASASCTASVNFQPTTTGSRSATVTFTSSSAQSPQTVSLTGTGLAPTLSVSPTSVSFGSTYLGVSSPGTVITLTNTGGSTVSLTSIQITGTNAGDFINSANTCKATLAAGAVCSVTVSFQPLDVGTRSASLTITDSASGSPQTVSLTGTGLAPTMSVTPASLSFGSVYVAGTLPLPAAQTVTLANTSGGVVTLAGNPTVTGTNAADFKGTNHCSATIAAGASCTVDVSFNPQGSGSRSASLTITSNAAGSPVNIALTGTGLTASLNVNTANSGSQTVAAGSTATYTVAVGGQGIGASASLSCSGLPTGAQCTVPNTVAVDATTVSTFTVTIATTSRTAAASLLPGPFTAQSWAWAFAVFGMVLLPGAGIRRRMRRISKRQWSGLMLLLALPLILLLSSCGGSSSSSGTNPNGTPAGTYTISVRATAANQPPSTGNLTLVVQ